ncbi:WD40 repeat-like protein [Lichtheimia hyalospora FSU 10163]|nr:WD40 repeat-like protein [Lichtheimia hyalospora FSU 10163]
MDLQSFDLVSSGDYRSRMALTEDESPGDARVTPNISNPPQRLVRRHTDIIRENANRCSRLYEQSSSSNTTNQLRNASSSSSLATNSINSWRRFSSSIARFWTRSDYEDNEDIGSVKSIVTTASSIPRTNSDCRIEDESDPENLLCPICTDLLTEVVVTTCGHTFCNQCIAQHMTRASDCPMCRTRLNSIQIFPNFQFNKVVEQYREEKRRRDRRIRTSQIDTKRKRSRILNEILKTVPYKEIMETITPLLEKKKQEEFDQKLAEDVLLEAFLEQLKERHKTSIADLEAKVRFIEDDLNQVQGKLGDNAVVSSSKVGMSTRNVGDGSDATVAKTNVTPYSNGKKRKVQEMLGLIPHEDEDETDAKIKRQRIFDRFKDLQDLYIGDSCKTMGATDNLKHISSLLYQTTRYSTFRVLDTMFHSDQSANSSIISSIEFDRDDEYFAIGGVSRDIKIFDYSMLADTIAANDTMDTGNEWPRGNRSTRGTGFIGDFRPSQLVHCPVRVIPAGNKLSCLSWNMYIKAHLASSDYEGTIRLWDANEGRCIRSFCEHEKRAWSVDICAANPTYLASGSDDATVKVWSTTMRQSVMSLRHGGNVCCAKFAPNVANYLAVGTADHVVTYYDLRFAAEPVHYYQGHKKAVSYVRWLDDNTIVSASTDNSLRRWNTLTNESTMSYTGHSNEKNFVGLSVCGDWISCGSEDNCVYAYHKDCKTPVASFKFPSTANPLEASLFPSADDGYRAFVSSSCWKSGTNTLLAANSKGVIKVLKLDR